VVALFPAAAHCTKNKAGTGIAPTVIVNVVRDREEFSAVESVFPD
jgi:hypothetical protein